MTKASRLRSAETLGLAVPSFEVLSANVSEDAVAAEVTSLLNTDLLKSVPLFSVRSSADVEDGEGLSFAGQFTTILNVQREDVHNAVLVCRASAKQQTAQAYAATANLSVHMDVIIQEMIDAEVSGVAFSANPNGMLNEAVIVVGKGAGTVVGDEVETTSYYYHLDEGNYYPVTVGSSPLLSHHHITEIISLLRQCMQTDGRYVDIEFAIRDNKVWLLQVRPITTLHTDDIVIFDNHNIVESYPGIALPLTQSFVTDAYTNIFQRLLQRMIGTQATTRYDLVLQQMVRPLNGRMYYQVSSWLSILQLMPFQKRVLGIWQEMVGVDVSLIKHTVAPRRSDKVKFVWAVVKSGFTVPAEMKQLHHRFEETERVFRKKDLHTLTVTQLLQEYNALSDRILKEWDVTLSNDMYAFIYTALYKKRAGSTAVLRTNVALPSTQLVDDYAALVKLYTEGEEDKFHAQLAVYCKKYGDRVPGELKLETETFRQNPQLLIDQIKKQATVPLATDDARIIETQEGFIARYYHKRAALGVYNRELSRLDRAKIFGMVREIMLTIGEQLHKDEALDDPRDVFYLTIDEIRHYSLGEYFQQHIAGLKAVYAQLDQIPAYSRLIFPQDGIVEKQVLAGTTFSWADETSAMFGTPSSPGVVEGEALVVTAIDAGLDANDKIIVAETTDPGWVFLLTQAKAVIAERGSLLSHTAIVSRELHKPSVVGVPGATRRIKTGDRIRVDGSTGKIEVLS